MDIVRVPGTRKDHKVLLYAISTCGWCKQAKTFLQNHGIEYEYIDIDKCSKEDLEKVKEDVIKRGGPLNFPTFVIDDKILITGFRQDKLKEVLKL